MPPSERAATGDEIDRHRAVGKRPLERDPHQAVGPRSDALLSDGRSEHVFDERLSRSRIEATYARRRVKREVVETGAKRLDEL